jgi:NADPH2:quinone reductase
MKALLSTRAGGPETLELADIAEPVPGPGEVLIAVHACGVNFPDALLLADKYQLRPPRPFAPGGEIAGVVESVGPDVRGFATGDCVIALPGWGGMVEKLVVRAESCTQMPAAMPFEHGATLVATFGTVYYGLNRRARLAAGERLLVLGAGGGIGLAAVEIGRAAGAHVVAAASTQEKVDLALSRGAASGFVYPTGADAADGKALAQIFKQGCGLDGVDVICDAVGDVYAEAAIRSIRWGGRYAVIGFAGGKIPHLPLNLPLLKGCDVLGVLYGAHVQRDPAAARTEIAELLQLYAAGKIRPHVSERFALADGGKAIAKIAAREALGKLVVLCG